jgi:hypothetical protein
MGFAVVVVAGDCGLLGIPRLEPGVVGAFGEGRDRLEAGEERLGRYWNREQVS